MWGTSRGTPSAVQSLEKYDIIVMVHVVVGSLCTVDMVDQQQNRCDSWNRLLLQI